VARQTVADFIRRYDFRQHWPENEKKEMTNGVEGFGGKGVNGVKHVEVAVDGVAADTTTVC
jgi:hypothetical protein